VGQTGKVTSLSRAPGFAGPDSVYLGQDLTGEARALRQLGGNEEAAKLEQRAQSLQSSQSAQMLMPPPSPAVTLDVIYEEQS